MYNTILLCFDVLFKTATGEKLGKNTGLHVCNSKCSATCLVLAHRISADFQIVQLPVWCLLIRLQLNFKLFQLLAWYLLIGFQLNFKLFQLSFNLQLVLKKSNLEVKNRISVVGAEKNYFNFFCRVAGMFNLILVLIIILKKGRPIRVPY